MTKLFRPEITRPNEVSLWETIWRRDGNVAAAWRCFRMARTWDLPVPASVLAELDRIAAAIEAEVEGVRNRHPEARGLSQEAAGRIVTRAGRGSADPAAALVAWERDIALASAVAILRADGVSEKDAVASVALGTRDIVTRFAETDTGYRIEPVATPAISPSAIRQAVRRVSALATDCCEIADFNEATA